MFSSFLEPHWGRGLALGARYYSGHLESSLGPGEARSAIIHFKHAATGDKFPEIMRMTLPDLLIRETGDGIRLIINPDITASLSLTCQEYLMF